MKQPIPNTEMEERLWNYIDGNVDDNEKLAIQQLLLQNDEWKAAYSTLLEVHETLPVLEWEAPSMRFTKSIMDSISLLPLPAMTKAHINKKAISAIVFLFLAGLLSVLIYGLSKLSWGKSTGLSFNNVFNKIDFSKFFNNSWMIVLFTINIVLVLFFVDNYIQIKRKKQHQA